MSLEVCHLIEFSVIEADYDHNNKGGFYATLELIFF